MQPRLDVNWKEILLGAFLAILPDFDYVLRWHHGFTHSFAFAFLVGSLVALCTWQFKWKKVLMYSLAVLSHPLLDFFLTETRGVELFWPFSKQRFTMRVPNPIDYTWRNPSVWASILDLLKISLLELLIFAPVFLIVLWWRRGGQERHTLS